jgi:hypothetical protein
MRRGMLKVEPVAIKFSELNHIFVDMNEEDHADFFRDNYYELVFHVKHGFYEFDFIDVAEPVNDMAKFVSDYIRTIQNTHRWNMLISNPDVFQECLDSSFLKLKVTALNSQENENDFISMLLKMKHNERIPFMKQDEERARKNFINHLIRFEPVEGFDFYKQPAWMRVNEFPDEFVKAPHNAKLILLEQCKDIFLECIEYLCLKVVPADNSGDWLFIHDLENSTGVSKNKFLKKNWESFNIHFRSGHVNVETI